MTYNMLELEKWEQKFTAIVNSDNWKRIETMYTDAKHVFLIGNGGNLAVVDHAAIDASRLTNKNIHSPGSAILATSIISDTSFNDWFMNWLEIRTRGIDTEEILVIAFSCSTTGHSSDAIMTALNWCKNNSINSALVAAQPKRDMSEDILFINQNVIHYHTSELISLALTYQLVHASGFSCPKIIDKSRERDFDLLGITPQIDTGWDNTLRATQWDKSMEVPPGFTGDLNNIAVDFDNVMHNFDRGFQDGTCYGELIEGTTEAIHRLAEDYTIIIFSGRAKPDRPLVNGQTGVEQIWDFLRKHDLDSYIADVTSEKPRAQYYIDDKGVYFRSWDAVFDEIAIREGK